MEEPKSRPETPAQARPARDETQSAAAIGVPTSAVKIVDAEDEF
ncbi:hypothetical protein WKI71_44995 [Streptomyces sp. MS1.AVA.1]|uniref:Uncharacterized protein n=1 Tax=Streptomyces machairae TaxID=3134109 RepID=A0ABU8UXK0_9ACTN